MKKTFVAVIVIFFIYPVHSWDEVTHAYMTQMIPDLIQDKKLKELLQNNIDEFIYGCWFTDTYQYTNDRVNKMNPHIITEYALAFSSYLKKEEVKKQDNYKKLVALYLGSLAHIMEDFWYDSNLNPYQKRKPDKFIGDSKHGAFVIKQNGYLKLKVKRYFPKEDLFKMYEEAGMLQKSFDTPDEFEEMFNNWSNKQYLLLRSLKFINYLGGNQMHNKSLWTAGNLKTIKGGMLNSAVVAAKFVEANWKNLNKKESPLFLHADYFYFENKIAVLASVPLANFDFNDVLLLTITGDTILGNSTRYAHPDKKKGIAQYAFSFFPNEKLRIGKKYRLLVKKEKKSFEYGFTNKGNQEELAKPKPFLHTIGLGIFGLVPMLATAGLFFGIAGINRFYWSDKNGAKKMPVQRIACNILMHLTGFFMLGIGIYLLVTRGAIIIDMAL